MTRRDEGDTTKIVVLVVDDEEDVVATLREHFESLGYVVETAFNGAAAVAAVREHRPDIVTLDMTMPDMSGLRALKLIQDIDASVPIVMITGNEDGVRTVEALKGGIVSYVPKPFNLRYLEPIVTAALGPRLARRRIRPQR